MVLRAGLSSLYKVVVMVFLGQCDRPVLFQVGEVTRENYDAIIKLQRLLGIHFNALKYTVDDKGLKHVPKLF